jgi:hypothetical protein
MSTPDSELDKHLRAFFGGLDTGADFDTRLMARLRAEAPTDAAERMLRARQQERARYRRALLELQGWRRSMLRLLTLDTLGIAFLLVIAGATIGPHLSQDVLNFSRHYTPYLATLLAVLVAAVPLAGMWAEQTRGPIGLR